MTLLAFLLLLVAWALLLVYEASRRNFLFLALLTAFAQQYVLPGVYYLVSGHITNRYFPTTESHLQTVYLLGLLFLFGVFLGQQCVPVARMTRVRAFYLTPPPFEFGKTKLALLLLSLVGVAVQWQNFSLMFGSETLTERLISNRGEGYLQFIFVASYLLVFLAIKQYLSGRLSLPWLVLHAVPAFLVYSLKLQRGHALYPLFFVLLTWLAARLRPRSLFLVVGLLAVVMLNVGTLTGALRSALVSGQEMSLTTETEDYIPDSYAHGELLAAVVADARTQHLPSTLTGSLVNWVPRAVFSHKPETLGPVLNRLYAPEASYYIRNGLHRSSYTTDPLIEGYCSLRVAGVFLHGFLFSLLCSMVWRQTTREKHRAYFFLTFPLSLFLWGFTSFFSDMGNWIGYLVIYYGSSLLLCLLAPKLPHDKHGISLS